MSALNITCAGAVYHGCATLEVMRYRCPQWQPGSDMPVNAAPEDADEAVEDAGEDVAAEASVSMETPETSEEDAE
ncbi:hypothetical protein LDHU3_32.4660:CDS1 [Leishmania donovani]|uniref:Hypothetical_protein n=2 Tax=Leishmania donovani species complex TaxID=38574 RepID=A0A6L0XXH4_LEIIN|nr:hypothetical protein LdCL_320042800 [Leishmania donovani]CAC9528102.1 hypothetical_protein [Leishmania infantum]CAJ1991905.1 hypothetical protein LDHU3_32.4660:CDS1 [Leishmania donovani]SUZ44940.1 hypothetical_protein [Leishmania infantum]VDZ47742.1 hypothetical_protein [Leishmania donovani]